MWMVRKGYTKGQKLKTKCVLRFFKALRMMKRWRGVIFTNK